MTRTAFRLDYTDAQTGQSVSRTIEKLHLAQQLAKELAQASGRRAVITRVRISPTKPLLWSVRVADLQTSEILDLWEGLSKREVLARWKLWKEHQTQAVLIAWPESFPQPKVTLDRAG
jgi:hypothetical protein